MAIGRISVKVGKKGKATAHNKYINGLDEYAQKTSEITYTQNGNMPSWAVDNPDLFWEMADEYERKNGSAYREHILSLPREFTLEQNITMLNEWIEKNLGDKHAYSLAIHEPLAKDGDKQPHCHLMFTDRVNDGIDREPHQFFKRYNSKDPKKGGAKKANTGMKQSERVEQLILTRKDWGDLLNRHLELNGFEPNIDMRNWEERGLSEAPKNKTMAETNLEKRLKKQMEQYLQDNPELQDDPKVRQDQPLRGELFQFLGLAPNEPAPNENKRAAKEERLPSSPTPGR